MGHPPPSPATPTLHHIAIGATDVEAMASFYAQAFALPEAARHHYPDGRLRAVWLQAGPLLLMFEDLHPTTPALSPARPGPFLLAFTTEPAQRHRAEARLMGLGAISCGQTDYTTYAHDPEGNAVAVSHYPLPPLAPPPGGAPHSG